MNYPITDSVLRRHYQQHLSAGGAELEGVTLDDNAGYDSTTSSTNSAVGQARTPANESMSAATSAASDATDSASGSMGFLKILLPVVIVALLAWFLLKG